jgi:hypothetical protein
VAVAQMGAELVAQVVAMHLGALHPYEKVLTLVLAFGPFIVLGAVIAVRRRHEDADEQPVDEQPVDEQPVDDLGARPSRPGPDRPTGP